MIGFINLFRRHKRLTDPSINMTCFISVFYFFYFCYPHKCKTAEFLDAYNTDKPTAFTESDGDETVLKEKSHPAAAGKPALNYSS